MTIGYAGSFLGGMAAILSPCAALVLPAFFAYAFGQARARLVGRTALFYLGLLITLVPLGLAAGALGGLLTTHRDTLAMVGGIVLIIFGLIMALGVQLPIPGLRQRGDPKGPVGAVLLGMTYGLAGACTGPLLGAVLTVAAVSGNAVRGGLLLALFGAGMVVPLVILALSWDKLKLGERMRPKPIKVGPFSTSLLGIVSGLLFIGVGILFITTDATSGIGGILDATQQFHLESWLREIGLNVPDLAVVAVIVLVAGFFLWRWLRRPAAD